MKAWADRTMNYEVEQKFPVADLKAVEKELAALGASVSAVQSEVDHYFAHPARDFAQTDEALRIRRADQYNSIAYKGPKVDRTTKTRREIELPLGPEEASAAGWEGLLEALGFRLIGEVCKRRRKAIVGWEGRQIEVSLDEVVDLGRFVELELVTQADDVASATASIASLARRLGLSGSQRKSYLELLQERQQGGDLPGGQPRNF